MAELSYLLRQILYLSINVAGYSIELQCSLTIRLCYLLGSKLLLPYRRKNCSPTNQVFFEEEMLELVIKQ